MNKFALFLLVILPAVVKAQNISIATSDKDLVEILKAIEKQTGVYFSYDPALFIREPKKSINYSNAKLEVVLTDLLGSKYEHERVGEYIVISIRKSKPLHTSPTSTSVRSKRQEITIFDTVKIEKVIYVYDTQRVVLKEKVFDTVRVKRTEIVYDTVRAQPSRKKFAWTPYLLFFTWTGSSSQLLASQIYTGVGVGLSREFILSERISLTAGIQYGRQFQNIKFPGDSTGSISDDSTTHQNISERVNQLDLLSLQGSFAIQILQVNKLMSMDVEVGLSMYKSLKADELFVKEDGSVVEAKLPDYRQPFYNLTVALPLSWSMSHRFNISVVPFFEWGLNKYTVSNLTLRREVAGIRFKFRYF